MNRGYTRLSHKIECLLMSSRITLKSPLTNSEKMMLLAVNRMTIGFNQDKCRYHTKYKKYIFELVEDIKNRQKRQAMQSLIDRDILNVFVVDGEIFIKINGDESKWK